MRLTLSAYIEQLKQIEDQRTERKQRRHKMLEFIRMLEHADGILTEFDEGVWNATVEVVIVQGDGSMVFRWKNGIEISASIKETVRECGT